MFIPARLEVPFSQASRSRIPQEACGLKRSPGGAASVAARTGSPAWHFAPTPEFLLQKFGEMARRGLLTPGEVDSCSRGYRGPAANTLGRTAGPCVHQGRCPHHGRSHDAPPDQAQKGGARTQASVLEADQNAEDPCSPNSGNTGTLAEVLATRMKNGKNSLPPSHSRAAKSFRRA
jgi:hypothetical protein